MRKKIGCEERFGRIDSGLDAGSRAVDERAGLLGPFMFLLPGLGTSFADDRDMFVVMYIRIRLRRKYHLCQDWMRLESQL